LRGEKLDDRDLVDDLVDRSANDERACALHIPERRRNRR